MDKFLLATLLLLTGHASPQDLIYKRNAFGNVEIYKSNYGVPTGQPIGVVQKSPLGYLEVKDLTKQNFFSQTVSPYSRAPQLLSVKPFLAPTAQYINSLNTYIDASKWQSEPFRQTTPSAGEMRLKQLYADMQTKYADILSFYGQIQNKPKQVADGWHNITSISPNPIKDILGGDKLVEVGYAYVRDNRVVKVIYNDFVSSPSFSAAAS